MKEKVLCATVRILDDVCCSLYCPFLKKEYKLISCILFNVPLSYEENKIYRQSACKQGKIK